eukprot:RCo034435
MNGMSGSHVNSAGSACAVCNCSNDEDEDGDDLETGGTVAYAAQMDGTCAFDSSPSCGAVPSGVVLATTSSAMSSGSRVETFGTPDRRLASALPPLEPLMTSPDLLEMSLVYQQAIKRRRVLFRDDHADDTSPLQNVPHSRVSSNGGSAGVRNAQ